MELLSVLPFLPAIAIILMAGSIVFRSPREKLHLALAEGAIWGATSIFAFGAEILLLAHI
ncbi:MAG: hypothetical protein A2061_10665 [Gallionellales bacterium GWA2_59_43]|nr:MAG: hypothetical protein A2061_10665 [Gallionellales bacterium GWA2_59_43]